MPITVHRSVWRRVSPRQSKNCTGILTTNIHTKRQYTDTIQPGFDLLPESPRFTRNTVARKTVTTVGRALNNAAWIVIWLPLATLTPLTEKLGFST